ncbi:site-specific DNA-methyltransferase [Patescibacteria group bacterium]|nr:site-specific DNA-methyltransferase [Patescibacteria group bacterium]
MNWNGLELPDKGMYFHDNDIVIYCADCRDILPSLPTVDLVLTDPPYFLPIQSYVGTRGNGYQKRMLGDLSVLKGYFELVFSDFEKVLNETGTYYVFCDAKSYPIFWQVMFPLCKNVRLLIWDKLISYNGYTWRHQHELIAWGELDKTERIPTGDGDVLKCRGVLQADRNHPAEKPVEVLEKLIAKHPAGIVLDPFMGSGSTLIASKNLNRKCIGIEIEEKYCKIATLRYIKSLAERSSDE